MQRFHALCVQTFVLLCMAVAPAGAATTVTGSQAAQTLRPGAGPVEVFRVQLTNTSLFGAMLNSIRFENRTAGPGSTAQRDAEWSAVRLSGPGRTVSASFAGGFVTFSGLNINLPAAPLLGSPTTVTLTLTAAPTLAARDGDQLDLRIAGVSDIDMSGGTSGSFPIDPAGTFPIDGMVASQIAIHPVNTSSFAVGSKRNLALDVTVPPNGYEADVLQSMIVTNTGSALPGQDVEQLELWVDDGDGMFEPSADELRGPLAFTGDAWQITGVNRAIPPAGRRVFVSVDVADLAVDGLTVRLGLPSSPSQGIGVQSANDGPLDRAVENPYQHALVTVDRVTLATRPIDPGTARPGDSSVPLLELVATNTYAGAKQLTGITFTNVTIGPGTVAERDGELQTLTLHADADDDGMLGPADPELGTALFIGGRAAFSGTAWDLAAGGSRHLFLTGDVSLLRAADGDQIGASLQGAADLTFGDPTSVAASWPLGAAPVWTIDGMRAAQVVNLGAPGATLAAGDGPVLALDLIVRGNGYQPDVLNGVGVMNAGTATAADIAELRLWRDGGDGTFGAGSGDDIDLGPLVANAAAWTSGALSVPLSPSGTRLFVAVTASGAPADSSTVRLAVPAMDGLVVQSGNDGPIDAGIENPEAILLSSRPLLATLSVTPAATTVGQNVTVTMRVRNAGSDSIAGVTPSALSVAAGGVLLQSGPVPASASLAPGGFQDFTWSYGTTAADTARFTGSASGTEQGTGNPAASHPAASNLLRIYDQVASLALGATSSLPANVSRGQHDVVPFFFAFSKTDAGGSDVLVRGLRVRLISETGGDVVPDDLLARVTVHAGATTYLDRATLETTGNTLDLPLATPIVVANGTPVTVAIGFDVDSATTVPNFRVEVPDETWFTCEDAVSQAPVTVVLQGASFPLRTGLARVVEAASELDVAAAPGTPVRTGQGQTDVRLLTLRLTSPGVSGVTSDARVNTFAVRLADTLGITRPLPGHVLERLRVRSGPLIVANRPVTATADSVMAFVLSPLVSVPVNTQVDVEVFADLADVATLGAYRLALADSVTFEARDPATGNRIPVVYATHPVMGPIVSVEAAADSMYARGVPQLPATVAAGAVGVPTMLALLRHPGGAGTADLALDSLVVRCVDEARSALVPAAYLDRVRLTWNGVEVANLPDLPAAGNAIGIGFAARQIAPGDVDTIGVVLDFLASAPSTAFEMTLHGSGLPARDANTGRAAEVAPEAGLEFPLPSGLTRLAAPARTLEAGLEDRMPASLAADGQAVAVANVTLRNAASAGSGAIEVDRVVVEAADAAYAPVAIGAGITRAALYRNGILWGSSAVLAEDSLVATITGSTLSIVPGAPQTLELRLWARAASRLAAFRVGIGAGDVGVIQPANPLLAVMVQPPAGQAFPLWTAPTSFAATDLEGSYSNFPNPFAAGREPTAFSYYMPGPGRVTLRLWSARGERVIGLLDDAPRAAGLHQQDVWDGRNGRGLLVTNGVYVAELIVRLDDGTHRRLIRKVAVVR